MKFKKNKWNADEASNFSKPTGLFSLSGIQLN
jgi:hypothetical protein